MMNIVTPDDDDKTVMEKVLRALSMKTEAHIGELIEETHLFNNEAGEVALDALYKREMITNGSTPDTIRITDFGREMAQSRK